MTRLESDRCPHSTTLNVSFRGCSHFHPVTFEAADFSGHPLDIHVTCRHLTAASVSGDPDTLEGPWYPRCTLGGPPRFPYLPLPSAGAMGDAAFVDDTVSALILESPEMTQDQLRELHRIRRLVD